jgi:hypothetical protein
MSVLSIKILERDADDWHELYVNGNLVYEGHEGSNDFFLAFVRAFDGIGNIVDFEFRKIMLDLDGATENTAPLHCFTDQTYWHDWEFATPRK